MSNREVSTYIPENTFRPFEWIRNSRIKTGLVLGLSAAALTGCASQPGGAPAPETSASAEPSTDPSYETPVDTAPDFDPSTIPENVVTTNLFANLTSEEQAIITEDASADVATFRASNSVDEQYKFGRFVLDNTLDTLKYRLDATGNSSLYQGLNLTTPEGVFKTVRLKSIGLSQLKTMTEADGIAYDTDTALKASVVLYADYVDQSAIDYVDAGLKENNLNTPIPPNPPKFVFGSDLGEGKFFVAGTSSSGENFQNTYQVRDVEIIDTETGETKVTQDAFLVTSVLESQTGYDHNVTN